MTTSGEIKSASGAAARPTPVIIAYVAALILLLWVPLGAEIVVLDPADDSTSVYLFDIALAVVAMAWAVHTISVLSVRTRSVWVVPTTALALWTLVSFIVNPSLGGWIFTLRALAAIGLACFLAELRQQDRKLVLAPFLLAGLVQAGIAIAQVVAQRDLGLRDYGERVGLFSISNTIVPVGTFNHPYVLAGFCCLAAGIATAITLRRPRAAGALTAGAAVAPVGLTLSRASLLALFFLVCLVAMRTVRSPRALPLLVALSVGIATPMFLTADAWLGRVDSSLSPSYDEDGSGVGGRLYLARESMRLSRENILFGVGPANYLVAAERQWENDFSGETSHSVPLLLTAELGVPAGMIFLILLIVAAARAIRSGLGATCIFLSFLPFFLLDHFGYDNARGLIFTAVWLGCTWSWRRTSLSADEDLIATPTRLTPDTPIPAATSTP